MDRDRIIEILREHRPSLERRGVHHAALFGSVARGEQRPNSDIDILIDIGDRPDLDVYQDVGLQDYIAELFEGPVDVVSRQGLKDHIRSSVLADAVYAF
ncbi:MAG: nucleotidyltransferase domain-containing protein [Mesorhizobium sp.]|nr:nucleotidyltransferase domain-containing protein [Mesorhizobium sp.]MCO5162379.1 nucleotidyltransferase domain-containing protein [Mesorhizobium sp.]